MKRHRTLYTAVFMANKRNGRVENAGKCVFADGRHTVYRTLWYDKESGEYVVMLNGNAYPFEPYKNQTSSEFMQGHI